MKRIVLASLIFISTSSAFGQKTEFSVSLNSGLFSFAGPSAESTSFINANPTLVINYTNNPYGTKNGFSLGVSANAKRIVKGGFILGLDFGYERLSSKITIDRVAVTSTAEAAAGKTNLNFDFLNLNPNIGYRFNAAKTSFDLTGGFDFGFVLKANEKGEATTASGTTYITERDRKNLSTDIRPRVQLATNYDKFGVYVGYSYGLSNYMQGYIGGGTWETSSRLTRFGLSYRIK
jgi:hypothetical protein